MKLKHAFYVILGAALVYGLFRRDAQLSQELANWKAAAQGAIVAGQAYRESRDSLIVEESRLSARLQALSGDLRRLGRAADSLAQIADTSLTMGPVRLALVASQNAGAACRVTLAVTDSGWATCRARASLAEARAARLDSLLRIGVKVQSCRVLGLLPCPSRGAALAAGVLGGFLLGRR